jgi:alcohol dehydrogenase class IV
MTISNGATMEIKKFDFHTPTRIVFGRGRLTDVAGEAASLGRRVLFVTTGAWSQPIVDLISERICDSGSVVAGQVETPAEPGPQAVDRAAAEAKAYLADVVIGIGGGSALDAAKGIAVVLALGGEAWSYVGRGKVDRPVLPVIAVPTTAGTGSETTPYAIFRNPELNRKAGIVSPFIAPRVAVLDPELTVGLPAPITAVSGIDAFAHALESFTSPTHNPVSDALARQALVLIGRHLIRAYHQGNDVEARSAMLLGSSLAGMAIAHAGTGLAHAVGATLGGFYPLEHGRVVGLTLPAAIRYNASAAGGLYVDVAEAIGLDTGGLSTAGAAQKLADHVGGWLNDMQLSASLAQLGVDRKDMPAMVKDTSTQNSIGNNIRSLDVAAIEAFYESLF